MKNGIIEIHSRIGKLTLILLLLIISSMTSVAQTTPKNYYWVGGSGSWQSPSTHWATTSGGSVFHSSVPTQFDRVIFDENSFSEAGQEVTMVAEGFCGEFRSKNIIPGVKFTAYKKLNIYNGFSIDSNLTVSITEGGISIIAGGFTIGKNVSFSSVGTFELSSGNMLVQRQAKFTQTGGDMIVSSGSVNLESQSVFNQSGTMTLGNGSFTVADSVKWTKILPLTLTNGNFIIGKNDTISISYYGSLNCVSGTVEIDSSSSIRLDYWTTIGKGDLRIRNGAKWECYHPLSILTGSLKVDSGGIYTQQYWVNIERSLDFHPSAIINNSARYYLHGDTAGLYIRTGNRDLRRIEIDGNNGEYTFLDDVKLSDDGVFLYGYNNTIRFNSSKIDVYNFYSWTNNPLTIDLTGIDTVNVKREYRVYNTTIVQGDPVIYFYGTDNFYMTGSGEVPSKTYKKIQILAENSGESEIYFLGRTTMKTVSGLAKGGQKLYFESPSIENLSMNFDKNITFTQTITQNNGSANIDTFNITSNYDISTQLLTYGSNHLGRLNIQKLVKWTIGSNQTQTLDTLIWPFSGTCGKEVILQSSQQGTAGTISMASGTLSADWLKIRDCIATGGAIFQADNTVNFGNVSGWNINAIPPRTFYWVGGTGNWDDGTHWSLSSGGTPLNCAIPNQADDVVFDENSFTSTGEYVNVNTTADVKNMTWGNVVSGVQFAGNADFNLWGSLELNSNMIYNLGGTLNFISTEKGNTIKTDNVKLGNVFFGRTTVSDTASWILQDDFNNEDATFYFQHGKLITNGKSIRSNVFFNWDAGTSYIDWTGTDTVYIKYQFFSWYNTEWTSRPGNIKFESSNNLYLIGGNHTYGNILMNALSPNSYVQFSNDIRAEDITVNATGMQYIVFYDFLSARDLRIHYLDTLDGTPTVDFQHNNGTFRNFYIEGSALKKPNVYWRYTNTYDSVVFKNIRLLYLAYGHTKTINNGMSILGGACDNRIDVYTDAYTTYLSMPTGKVFSGDWLNIRNVHVSGGGTFNVTNALDQGGNSGWNLQTVPTTNFYWVGGSGNWSDKNHWSFTSGGTPGTCPVPSQNDNVFFDVNSFTAPDQYVYVDITANCLNMNWNNVNKPRIVGNSTLTIYGSLLLDGQMKWYHDGWTVFKSDSLGNTITTNGIKMHLLSFDGKGEWTLGDNISANYDMNINSGTFRSGGHTITLGRNFSCWTGVPTTVDFTGTDTVTVGGEFRIFPNDFKLTMGDAVVKFRGNNNFYFIGGNNTYNDIIFNADNTGYSEISLDYNNTIRNLKINAAGYQRVNLNSSSTYNDVTMLFRNKTYNNPQVYVSGNNTFNDMTITSIGNAGPYIYYYYNNTFNNLIIAGVGTRVFMGANQTQTVNDALALGNGSYPVWLRSTTENVQATINKPTGSVCMDFIWLRDMKATGGAVFNAGATSLDQGNNTNWLFTSCAGFYWVGDAGNWSDYSHHWAYSSGGTILHNTMPTQFDDVFFDANSFTTNGQTVTIDVPDARAHNLSFASALYTPTIKSLPSIDEINIYGSLRLITNMNQSFTGKWNFKANSDSNEINTADHTLGEVNFIGGNDGEGGWILRNNLTVNGSINLNNGTFYSNGKEVTAKYFNSSTTRTRKLYLGSSIINIADGAWNPSNLTNFTFSKGSSEIVIKGSGNSDFYGNGLDYNKVVFRSNGAMTSQLKGANSYHLLRFEEGVNALLDPVTQQADKFEFEGTCAKPVNIQSQSANVPFTFNQSSGTVNGRFLQIKDNIATGGATFNANQSQDLGNVSGWNFTTAPIISISTSSGLVNCTLNNDGWAKVRVLQGQSPFKFLWSTNETKDSISGLIPGTYTITVIDSNGCKATDAVSVVNEPSAIAPANWNASAFNICQGTTIDFTPDEVSTALSFNGQNSYVRVTNSDSLNTSNFTLEAWIKADQSQTSNATILDKGSTLNNTTGWALQFNGSNGNIQFWTPVGVVVSASQVNDNNWHHIAVSYDGSDLLLYIDGVLENTNTIGVLTNSNTSDFLIGNSDNGSNYFKGLIDEVRIWSIARAEIDIQANRNIDLQGKETNLVAYYNMEYDYGTTRLKDLTLNGNHGILNNFDSTTAWVSPGAVNSTVSYIWRFGDFTTSTNKTPSKLYTEAGTYSVTLGTYDQNNCPNFVTKIIKVSKITQDVTKVDIACKGENNGSIAVNTSGGISPYFYSIDNGQNYDTTSSFTGLTSGLYQVKVKDSIGCVTNAENYNITEPNAPLTFSLIQTPACLGTPNGTITVIPNGGTTPYQYSKNFGVSFQSSEVFDQLNTGSYTIRVRDANKCLAKDSTILVQELDVTKDGGIISGSTTVIPDINNVTLRLSGNKGTIEKWQSSSDSLFSSTSDIANTTDSLNVVNLSATTYYRAVINVGVCGTVYSDFAEIVVSAVSKRIWISDTSSFTQFTYCPGSTSSPRKFTIVGTNLLSDITINAPDGFEFSLDSLTGYGNQIILQAVSGAVDSTRIYVRTPSTVTGSPSGSIDASSQYAYTESISVAATPYILPVVNISPNGATICTADSIQLEATSYSSYVWSTGETTQTITVKTAGNYSVTITDNNGCIAKDTVSIIILDTIKPVIILPADTLVNCNAIKDTSALGAAVATDNCDKSPVISYREENLQGTDSTQSNYYNYTIYRWWKATDITGNVDSAKQTILVQDTTKPVLILPKDTTVNCNVSKDTSVLGKAIATDICDAAPAITYRDDNQQGTDPSKSGFYNYTIYRWWKATDITGNVDSAKQTILVQDTTKPTFTQPADITIYTNATCLYDSTISIIGDVTDEADNCSTGLNATYTDTLSNGSCQGSKSIKRTWILTDVSGNITTKVQTITVSDTLKPTFTVPADITIYTVTGCAFDSTISKTGDVTDEADNCSTGLNATHSDAIVNGACEGTKIITRTWRLEDSCGNVTSKIQTITVSDTTRPVISVCRSNATRNSNVGLATYSISGTELNITATDQCSSAGNISYHYLLSGATQRSVSGTLDAVTINLGTTYVKAFAKDHCGNVSDTCFYSITVQSVSTNISLSNFTITPITPQVTNVINGPSPSPTYVQYSDSVLVTAQVQPWPTDVSAEYRPSGKIVLTLGSRVYDGIDVEEGGFVHFKTALTDKEFDYLHYNAGQPTQGEYKPDAIAKSMKAQFKSSNSNYADVELTKDNAYIINNENAIIQVDNINTYFTVNPANKKGTVLFRANLIDSSDLAQGDIRNATVQFYDATSGTSVKLGSPLNVGLMDPLNNTYGTSVYTFDYTLNNNEASAGGKTWIEWAEAGNYYQGGDRSSMNVITLAMPGSEYVTGSGSYVMEQSNGLYAGTKGKRMNFGLNMKWNSSGKNLQGQVNVIFRRMVNGITRLYHIKSNAIDALGVTNVNMTDIDGQTRSYNVANISTKSSLTDITNPSNPISMGGNLLLNIVAYDDKNQETIGKWDKISVELLGNNSQLLFGSYVSGGRTQVQNINGGNLNVRSTSTSATTSCAQSTGLQTKDITTNGALTIWSSSTGILRYNLRYRVQGASTWILINNITSDTSYILNNLLPGTPYEWGVQKVCSLTDSSNYTSTLFTTMQDCTLPPVDLITSSITISSASISWKAVTGVSSYSLEFKSTSDNYWTSVSTMVIGNSYILTGLNEYTTYQWRVRSNCNYGVPAWAESLAFTTLSSCMVAGQSVTNITTNSVRLKWDAVTSTTSTYNVRWKDSSAINWTEALVSANYHDIAGLLPSTTYLFQVQPICNDIPGIWTNPTYFKTLSVCSIPAGIQITNINLTSAVVKWNAVTGSTGYTLGYRLQNAISWTLLNTTSTSVSITGLTSASTYEVRVKNQCASGSSDWTTSVNFKTLIECKATGLQAQTSSTSNNVTMSWTGPVGATYKLEFKKSNVNNWTSYSAGTNTSFTTSLVKNAKYDWRVTTYCNGVTGATVNGLAFIIGSGQTYTDGGLFSSLEMPIVAQEGYIEAYPNPTIGDIDLYLRDFKKGKVGIKVVDILGNVINVQELSIYNGNSKLQLSLLGRSKGVYFVQVIQDDKVRTLKVLKL